MTLFQHQLTIDDVNEMSEGVVGLTVRVTLKPPREWVLEGIVASVVDQKLQVRDVYFPKSKGKLETFFVLGTEIADLEIIPARPAQPVAPPPPRCKSSIALIPASVARPVQRPVQKVPTSFVDPAILSFAKAALQNEASSIANDTLAENAPKRVPAPTAANGADSSIPPRSILKRSTDTIHIDGDVPRTLTDAMAAVSITKEPAVNNASIGTVEQEQEIHQPLAAAVVTVKSSRDKRRKGGSAKSSEHAQVDFVTEAVSPAKSSTSRGKKTPGWRQTPLLEQQPSNEPSSTRNGDGLGSTKKTRHQRQLEAEMKNGWGTEDATDIQELGDFDFEANLSKFDKRSVFNQLKMEDTTADEERLVSFNRALPGTFGGKNLHPSENVLSEPAQKNGLGIVNKSDSEVEEGIEGSTSSRKIRPRSRAASRQGGLLNQKGSGTPPIDVRRASVHSMSRVGQLAARVKSPRDDSTNASLTGLPSLRYINTDRACVPATPEALDAIEAVAKNISGLSEDILSENAGRCIAEVALSALNPGGRRLTGNHNAQPVVVVLVGDNRAGARALAAARHLAERGIRIVACTTGPTSAYYEAYSPYSDVLGPQIQRLGKGHMSWDKAIVYLKTLNAPPELIIDALLDTHNTFDELDDSDAAIAEEMLDWANRSKASVLAIDIPSGVNAKTGEVEVMEGEPLEVRAKIVACCGAPVTGLLKAMELRHAEEEHDWRVFICDIGINSTWRDVSKGKDRIRGGKPIAFGGEWVVGVRFDAGGA